jgi:hypothetical protein
MASILPHRKKQALAGVVSAAAWYYFPTTAEKITRRRSFDRVIEALAVVFDCFETQVWCEVENS